MDLLHFVFVFSTNSAISCTSGSLHPIQYNKTTVCNYYVVLRSSSRIWFLSRFNCNFIFNLIKSDFVTRTQKEAKSSVKCISNNEVVFTNNEHYRYLLSQIWIVDIGISLVVILCHCYQKGRNEWCYNGDGNNKFYSKSKLFIIIIILELFSSSLPLLGVFWAFSSLYAVAMHLKM